jgi:1-acyl-sn-glycerol-3-phosphate acyltransferase
LIWLLKIFIRAALWLFCVDINIQNKSHLKTKGPLLIIANHPNSFLDAIIIATQYKRRVYFLARGDAFLKKHHRFLLGLLNMIPVYRLREGKQYLHLNDYAFKESIRLLKKGEAVLIFIEGTCINSHELQPFKKGATRILEGAHKECIFPLIHIAGIGYNHFRGIGKKINISIEKFIFEQKTIVTAKDRVLFNKQSFDVLKQNIIPPIQPPVIYKTPLYYFHLPYYKFIHFLADKKTRGTVFYDSVLFSLLLFTYPIFLLLLFLILYFLTIPLPIIFGILFCIPLLSKYTIKT